ncbi:MAG: hypothetical protein ACI92G_000804 [Candidatus Pelagisphaera sp.]|jgi:hypothetical protein
MCPINTYKKRYLIIWTEPLLARLILFFIIVFVWNPSRLAMGQAAVRGLVYYAVENLDNDSVVTRGVTGSQGVAFDNLTLAPNTNFRIWLLEAATFRTANVELRTPTAGVRFNVPPFFFTQSSSHDSDADGLHDLGEFIVGTKGLERDSDEDGILDSSEVREGTDPLEGSPARTGILGSSDTQGNAQDIDAFNDVVVVADSNSGIVVFNIFNGMDPLVIAQVNTPGSARAVSIGGNLLGIADGSAGFSVVDLSDPPTASILHQMPLGSDVVSVDADGQIAFVGLTSGEVVAIDMVSGVEIDRIDLSSSMIDDLQIYGDVIFACQQSSLYSLSFEFSELSLLGTVASPGTRNSANGRMRLFVADDVAYHVHRSGYNTLDVSDPISMSFINNQIATSFGWKHIVTNGNGLGLAAVSTNSNFGGAQHVSLYDVSDPDVTTAFITEFQTPGVARAVTIYNGIGYVADHTAGMQVVNYLAYDGLGVPPTISIVSPNDGDSVEEGSSVRVRVEVSDDVQVRNVEFYVENELVKTDGNHSFEATVPVGSGKAGDVVEIVVRASDTGGNAAFSAPIALNLTPDATPPRVTAVFPRDNSIIGETSGLTLFFSEAIDPVTIGESSILLKGEGEDGFIGTPDDVVIGDGEFTQSEDGAIVSYSLSEALDTGYFSITVEPSITDAIGNQLRARFISVFLALGDADTDRDGLPDFVELSVGLDPNDPDSDDDGIFDGQEDQDGDNVPNDVESFLGFSLTEVDSDLNGITDDLEDRDMDGLPDFREILAGSSIDNPDSDGDGFSDEAEVISGSSPINPDDRPFQLVVSRPDVNVLALSSNTGAVSPGVTIANPAVSVLVLSSSTGALAPGVTVANPAISVLALSSQSGDVGTGVTVGRPSVSVLALSSDDGDLPPGITVGKPSVSVLALSSQSGNLEPGVTLANPPVEVTHTGD